MASREIRDEKQAMPMGEEQSAKLQVPAPPTSQPTIQIQVSEEMQKQLVDMAKGDPEAPGFKYFLMAMQAGMPPEGGVAIGLERLTQKILGLQNVKEASLFPRDINRLAP